jgi:hypothetical protein
MEEVSFKGKSIILQSAADAAVMKVPAGGNYAFSFYRDEDESTILRNFVITGYPLGAIFCWGASPTVSHLTIVDNGFGIIARKNFAISISNCIFWNNTYGDLQDCQANYSCLINPLSGVGNISKDPLFADPNNGDYHLKSQFGRYLPNTGEDIDTAQEAVWVVDDQNSPCIDAGDPAVYPREELEDNGGRVNIGAYGGTAYASKSPPSQIEDPNHLDL